MELFSPTVVGIVLAVLAIFVIGAIYSLFKGSRGRQPAAQQTRVEAPVRIETRPAPPKLEYVTLAPARPSGPSPGALAAAKLARPVLFLAAVVCGALLLLLVMPESWFQLLARTTRGSHVLDGPEPLWLESMGEDRAGGELRVYGTIRNATPQEIPEPQVVLKIYGQDGSLLTAVVAPTRGVTLAPQAVTEFSVVYQQNPEQISRFAVSFKTPDGTPLLHKDIRGGQPQ